MLNLFLEEEVEEVIQQIKVYLSTNKNQFLQIALNQEYSELLKL